MVMTNGDVDDHYGDNDDDTANLDENLKLSKFFFCTVSFDP